VLEIGLSRFFTLRCSFCTLSFERQVRTAQVAFEQGSSREPWAKLCSPESPIRNCIPSPFKRDCPYLKSKGFQGKMVV
jgi:hypothetical protein